MRIAVGPVCSISEFNCCKCIRQMSPPTVTRKRRVDRITMLSAASSSTSSDTRRSTRGLQQVPRTNSRNTAPSSNCRRCSSWWTIRYERQRAPSAIDSSGQFLGCLAAFIPRFDLSRLAVNGVVAPRVVLAPSELSPFVSTFISIIQSSVDLSALWCSNCIQDVITGRRSQTARRRTYRVTSQWRRPFTAVVWQRFFLTEFEKLVQTLPFNSRRRRRLVLVAVVGWSRCLSICMPQAHLFYFVVWTRNPRVSVVVCHIGLNILR